MAEDTRTVALPNITAADFSIDAQGQVVVRNPALAERIKSSAELRPDLAEAAGRTLAAGRYWPRTQRVATTRVAQPPRRSVPWLSSWGCRA